MHATIREGQTGLRWKNGKIIGELMPGKYRYWPMLGEEITNIDTVPKPLVTGVEEYATKDNFVVRMNVMLMSQIIDVTEYVRAGSDWYTPIRLMVIGLLRAEVAALTLEELLEKDLSELQQRIMTEANERLKEVGLTIGRIEPLALLLPRSLRQAFEAEVVARKRAAADMEEARGRTAVLRHLANAARQVEQQPVLLQLLMGQKAKHVQFLFDAQQKPHTK